MGERNAIHSIVALLLHLLLLEVDVAAAANCGSKPLYFPAGSFPLPNSFPITLGTPPQRLGLILSTNSNDTYVPSRYECTQFKRYKLPSEAFCEKGVGGVFNPENSTTYRRLQALDVPDFLDNPFRGANGSLSTDTLTLQMEDQNLTLSNLQFGLIDEATQYTNMIGLGPGSVLLEALFKTGNIPSKSYSIDLMQQTLILGGYDAAGLDGTFDTFPLEPRSNRFSYLHVEVADILVRPSRGAAPVSLMADKSPFNISVVTALGLLLPQDVTTAYMKRTSADVIPMSEIPDLGYLDAVAPDLSPLRHASHFSGDLTLVLSSGLRTTIPNQDLVYNVTTTTNGTVELSRVLASGVRPPFLGSQWLAGIVIAVDYEQGRFGLAKSNRDMAEEPRLQPKERRIMALGCDGHLLEGNGDGQSGQQQQAKTGLSAGVIAGIVCGVVGALLLLVLVLWRLKPCWARKATPPLTVRTTEIVQNEVVEAPQAKRAGLFVEMGLGDERLHTELAG